MERREEASRYECVSPASINARYSFWSGNSVDVSSFTTGACICSKPSTLFAGDLRSPLMGAVCMWGWGKPEPWYEYAGDIFGGESSRVIAFTNQPFPLRDYRYVCDGVRDRSPHEAEEFLMELVVPAQASSHETEEFLTEPKGLPPSDNGVPVRE